MNFFFTILIFIENFSHSLEDARLKLKNMPLSNIYKICLDVNFQTRLNDKYVGPIFHSNKIWQV